MLSSHPPRNTTHLDFTTRATLREWMDEPCSYEDFRACLLSLRRSNRLTFNYRPTLLWLRQFRGTTTPLHILDIGSGGGDMLRRIEHWASRNRVPVTLTGIDLNPHSTRAAQEVTPASSRIRFLTGDAFTTPYETPPTHIVSSLLTHHLTEPEIVQLLVWMEATATQGWFINDLHRDPMPYHLYRALAKLLRFHPFVQHDGPISIRRAFRAGDWQRMLRAAGLQTSAVIQAVKPARLCVSRVKAHV